MFFYVVHLDLLYNFYCLISYFPIEIKKNIEWNKCIEKYGKTIWISALTKYQNEMAQVIKEMIENKKKEYIFVDGKFRLH